MKFIHILIFSLFVLFLSSCDKMPINGDLDGIWQIVSEQQVGSASVTDKKYERLYVSFQLHTAQFDVSGDVGKYYSTFTRKNDTLQFIRLCKKSMNATHEDDNIPLQADEITDCMGPWGIYRLDPKFKIESLSSKYMVLRSDYSTLRLKKF